MLRDQNSLSLLLSHSYEGTSIIATNVCIDSQLPHFLTLISYFKHFSSWAGFGTASCADPACTAAP